MGEQNNVIVRRDSKFYGWLEAKPIELRLSALKHSILNPMQEQGMSRTVITSILRQLSLDCYVSLTPLPSQLVQQFTRTQCRSSRADISDVIDVSSDDSDEEFNKTSLISRKPRKINTILSDDDDDDVQVIEDESCPSSVLQTEIQVSIKVCGPGNIQPKLFDLNKQEVNPLSLPECSNQYSSSSENNTSSDDICFEKLNKRKQRKLYECFGEDIEEAPKLKIRKLSDTAKKKASIDKSNEDMFSESSDKLSSVNSVLKEKVKRKSSNDIEKHCANYTETWPVSKASDNCISEIEPQKNKKGRAHKNEKRKEKCKRSDVEKKESRKKKIHKPRKSSTKESKRNSKITSSATNNYSINTSVSSIINHSVDELWSDLGMESPYERSNIIKSFPVTTTISVNNTNINNQHEQNNRNAENFNSFSDQSNFNFSSSKIVSSIVTKATVSNIQTTNQTSSTTVSSPKQNIINNLDLNARNEIRTSDNACETHTSNVGKIRLRDPKTLMISSDYICDPLQSNTFPTIEVSRSTENNVAKSIDVSFPPGSTAHDQPSMIIHHLPSNQGDLQLSSETYQSQADCTKGHTGSDNERFNSYIKFYKWYFEQDIEVKSSKMSEILHVVIAARICRDERLIQATKLMSKNSFDEEKRRVERDYSDTLRIRGNEFKVLFYDVIENVLVLPTREIMIILLYCKIITGLLKIEKTNDKFYLSARFLICEMLRKNGYKNQFVYELFRHSSENFESKYREIQPLIDALTKIKSHEMCRNSKQNSENANLSHKERSDNAGDGVNLAFDIRRNLEQHIEPREKANRISQQQETVHFVAQSTSGIESVCNKLNPNSVIKHVSSTNHPNFSNVGIENATTSPNGANQSSSTLPINSVSSSQQNLTIPPPYYGSHQIVQNNSNIARVNPNVSDLHISPRFGRTEYEKHNYNFQQQSLHGRSNGQMYQEPSKGVSSLNPQIQPAQQVQNVSKTADKISYYSQLSKEYQQTGPIQNGYKMLSPQNGRIVNTPQNDNSEKLAMENRQYGQTQNLYRRLSTEHQQAEKIKSTSLQHLINYAQPGQNYRTQQTSESVSPLNYQNVQKPTDYRVTPALLTPEQSNHRQITKPTEIRDVNLVVQENGSTSNNHENQFNSNQVNIQSGVNNYSESNPHAISYARLRQTSAIQNHREVKRALVHPMVNKPTPKFNLPGSQSTVTPSSNRNLPICAPVLHNGYTNLYQPSLDLQNKDQTLHDAVVETKQKDKEQLLSDQFLEKQQTLNKTHDYIQSDQLDKTHLGLSAFQNLPTNSSTYTSPSSQYLGQYFGHPAQHISQMNTLNNVTTHQSNQNQAIYQSNISSQYQQVNIPNTISPSKINEKAINNQSHSTAPQNSLNDRNETLLSAILKSPNLTETNFTKQNQNCSINNGDPKVQNPTTSENNKSDFRNTNVITNTFIQQNSDLIKSFFHLQDSNVTISECMKATKTCSETDLRRSDKNVPLQTVNEKSSTMNYQAVAQPSVQYNSIQNVPNQKEVIQSHTSSTLNQPQISNNNSLSWREQNIRNKLGVSVSASCNVEKQINAVSQQNFHSPSRGTQKLMDQSSPSKIQIHSVHSQSPNVFYKNQKESTTNKQNSCSNNKCSNEAKVLCSGCQNACYCSRQCQSLHWYDGHHAVCSTL